MLLTEQQVEQFYKDGFVVVKDVIPQEKLSEYRDAFERMVTKVRANPSREKYNTRLIRGNDRECWGCDYLLHPDLYEPAFTDYLNNGKLLSSLSSILGDDLRVSGLKAIWSPANADYDLGWHRDGPKAVYSEDGTQEYIQFNTALYHDDSFRVVPGSHLRPLTEEENAKYGGVEDLTDQQICVLEPGDAMFMHAAVVHRGKAPSTVKRRTLHYILARTDFHVGTKRLKQFKGWYDELKLDEQLAPTAAKKLFDNFFAWEGRTFDDHFYPGLPYKE